MTFVKMFDLNITILGPFLKSFLLYFWSISPANFDIFEILDRKFTEETLIQDSELLGHARKKIFIRTQSTGKILIFIVKIHAETS